MLHKTGIHLFLLRNMLRSCSKLKETSFIRIFHESPKLRRIWFVWRVFLENWKKNLMLFTRWKSYNGHLCYTVEKSEVFICKENLFGVAFNRCLEDTIFLCGLLFQKPTMASPNCKDQYLPKKRSRTNKRTTIKDLFVFWTFKGTSLDLNWFYRSPGR